MKRIFIIVLLFALLIGGFVAANLRRETRLVWEGMDIETQMRQGSLYGAARLLQEYGHPDVTNRMTLYGFNDKALQYADNSLLLIANTDRELSENDADRLLSWVESGNTLVISLSEYSPFRTRFLERLGVRISHTRSGRRISEDDGEHKKQPDIPVAPSCEQYEQRRIRQLQLVGVPDNNPNRAEKRHQLLQACSRAIHTIRLPEGRALSVYSDSDAHIQSTNNPKIWLDSQNPNGNHAFLGIHYRQGRVLVTDNLDFLTNPQNPLGVRHTLDSHDHAYFLVYLAQQHDSVHLIHQWNPQGELFPSPAWLKIWRSQPITLALMLVTLIIGVWHITSRTGSIRTLPPAPERSLKQHLLAQGRFFSRHFSKRAILQQLQQELLEEWQARHPGWKKLNGEQRLQLLVHQTRLPPSQLQTWLSPLPEEISHTQWLQLLQSHRQIRRNRTP